MSRLFNVGRFAPTDEPLEAQVLRCCNLSYDRRIAEIESAPDGRFIDMHGMLFKLGPSHLRPSQLQPLRAVGDPLADSVTRIIFAEVKDPARGKRSGLYDYGYDAVARVEELLAAGNPAASDLMCSMLSVPSWVNMQRVRAGADFFCANVVSAGTCLMNLSLIGGFGAWRINKVLESTAYLSSGRDHAHRRLLETLMFVLDCCSPSSSTSIQAMAPGGCGWRAAFAVRMVHSSVRVRLTTCGRTRWDSDTYGAPINAEDMAATLLGFSVVVLIGLERAGLLWHVSNQECEDYLHLWRLVGHWLGLPPDLSARLDSVASALCLLESILPHIIDSDESSRRLVLASLQAVAFRAPFFWSMSDLVSLSRHFAGDYLADSLGIPRSDDACLCYLIEDHHPTTSFPSETKYVLCSNVDIALRLPSSSSAAAKCFTALVSSVLRCAKFCRGLFSRGDILPLSFRIIPFFLKFDSMKRLLAPLLHGRVKSMVECRLALRK
jgi:hypothetical protein